MKTIEPNSNALQLDLFSQIGDGHFSYVTDLPPVKAKALHKKNGQIQDIDDLKSHIRLLTKREQQYLRNWLDYLLEEEEIEPPIRSEREVIRQQRVGAIVYQLEKIQCGKKCHKCPHGPYWYGYRRVEGKVKSFYVGKNPPAGV